MARIERLIETEDGYTEWVNPVMDNYKMACCDCGLVHDINFQVVKVTGKHKDGTWDWRGLDIDKYRVRLQAKRNNRSTAQVRRIR